MVQENLSEVMISGSAHALAMVMLCRSKCI